MLDSYSDDAKHFFQNVDSSFFFREKLRDEFFGVRGYDKHFNLKIITLFTNSNT